MKRSALCLVDNEDQAETIVESLESKGFSDNDVSVLFPDKESSRNFAHKKATKMPEGATLGAGTGGAVGGTIGLLATLDLRGDRRGQQPRCEHVPGRDGGNRPSPKLNPRSSARL